MVVARTSIQALVINLDRFPERMQFQHQQLQRLGISYQRLSAVDKQQLSDEVYQRWACDWERVMRPAEVACFLSHRQAWQRVFDTQQSWLILEDDALLNHDVSLLLDAVADHQRQGKADMITFEAHGRRKLVGKSGEVLASDYQLLPLFQDRTGAAGYVLFPDGARQLLDRVERKGAALADALISSTYSLQAFQIEPAPIIQLDQTSYYGITGYAVPESIISPPSLVIQDWVKHPPHWRLRKNRFLGQLRMGARFWRYPWLAERREIRVDPESFIIKEGKRVVAMGGLEPPTPEL